MISDSLADTLEMLAPAARDAVDHWWLIGSAAVALHGGRVPHVNDVDLLMSIRDADEFLRQVGAVQGGAEASERFRSSVFGVWKAPPLHVEVFGGFKVQSRHGWREVRLFTREPIKVREAIVYVPSATELIRLLHSFGRTKDVERAALLRN